MLKKIGKSLIINRVHKLTNSYLNIKNIYSWNVWRIIMKWTKVEIDTITEAVDLIYVMLDDLGIEGIQIVIMNLIK